MGNVEIQPGARVFSGIQSQPVECNKTEFYRWHCTVCNASGPWLTSPDAVKPQNHTRCPGSR